MRLAQKPSGLVDNCAPITSRSHSVEMVCAGRLAQAWSHRREANCVAVFVCFVLASAIVYRTTPPARRLYLVYPTSANVTQRQDYSANRPISPSKRLSEYRIQTTAKPLLDSQGNKRKTSPSEQLSQDQPKLQARSEKRPSVLPVQKLEASPPKLAQPNAPAVSKPLPENGMGTPKDRNTQATSKARFDSPMEKPETLPSRRLSNDHANIRAASELSPPSKSRSSSTLTSPPKRLGYPIAVEHEKIPFHSLTEGTLKLQNENYDLGSAFELATKSQVMEYITKSKSLTFKPNPHQLINSTLNPCFREPSHKSSFRPKIYSGRVCMPYFYIGAFAKSGTTGLWSHLVRHPEVVGLVENPHLRLVGKESHWFTRFRFDFYRKRYRRKFPHRETMSRFFHLFDKVDIRKEKSVVGDGSPDTIWDQEFLAQDRDLTSPLSPATDEALRNFRLTIVQIIHQYTPNSKYIIMMRNPTDRLISNYIYMSKKSEISKKTFHNFVAQMVLKLNACFKARDVRSCIYDPTLRSEQNKAKIRLFLGIFVVPIIDLMRVVPHENVIFIHFDDYVHKTRETVTRVLKFLGLRADPESMKGMNFAHIVNKRPKDKPANMLPETRAILDRFYAPFNRILAEKLNDERYNWPIRDAS